MEVHDASGQNLGEVKDVVLDGEKGTIAYAVVAFAGVASMQDKLFAMPWGTLKAAGTRNAFVLDMPKDRLEKAPGFEKNQWPDMADAKWTTEVQAFYGVERTDRRERVAVAVTEEREVSRETVTHAGKVRTFTRGNPALVVVGTTDHGDVQGELAPMEFIERQQLTLDPNANVSLKGYHTMKNGRDVFVVTEVTAANGKIIRLRRDDKSPMWAETPADRTAAKTTVDRANGTTTVREMSGTVTHVDNSACGESTEGRMVTLRTADGVRVVGLGSGAYLDSQRWSVRANEAFTVRGYDQDRNGTPVFIVTEARKGNEVWKLRNEDGTQLRR